MKPQKGEICSLPAGRGFCAYIWGAGALRMHKGSEHLTEEKIPGNGEKVQGEGREVASKRIPAEFYTSVTYARYFFMSFN